MRVHVVDPSAYTRPYDHALCHALAREGADVELVTSAFAHGDVPAPDGYRLRESFYRRGGGVAGKLAQHVPDMLRERRAAARGADVAHFQWLVVPHVDGLLLPRAPLVLTAHDVLAREPRPGQLAAERRLYERADAVVVHTEHGRARLTGELGVDPARVHVIPHGVLDGLAAVEPALPPELPEPDRPVVLLFGLLRPYKGLDVLLEAWRGIDEAELWIVGAPRMEVGDLRASAPAGVRWVTRFVSDAEAAAVFARATLAVLPYREIEQSGVLWTAVGLGVPVLASDVGGFSEVEGVTLVAPGDPAALHDALRRAIADPPAAVDPSPYGWGEIARAHLALYRSLL
ncbi:MAG TPA: glycosyltransferase [Solirubrobacteraceae bacterium]|nr:glycosyltransferase [Solirubrobacteraceae bacterium]